MTVNRLQETLDEAQAANLPLITACLAGVQILSALRDLSLVGPEVGWLMALNGVLIAVVLLITLLAHLHRIANDFSQLAAALCMLCVAIKPALALTFSDDPRPLYLAIVLLGSALALLSWHYLLSILLLTLAAWFVVAVDVLAPEQLFANGIIGLFAVLMAVLIQRRRIGGIRQIAQLRERVDSLESILPMCANCKKTRDSEGHWMSVERYIELNEEKLVSHGICPDCKQALYGEYFDERAGQAAH